MPISASEMNGPEPGRRPALRSWDTRIPGCWAFQPLPIGGDTRRLAAEPAGRSVAFTNRCRFPERFSRAGGIPL
jgi:hypothetical protein